MTHLTIPKPLVQANQFTIVLSVIAFALTSNPLWLLIPLLSGLSSLFFGFHPIMALVKRFIRKPLKDFPQEDKTQQRFNQILAVSMLSASFISALLDQVVLSYLFAALVFAAASVALMGFCIGCFIHYQLNQYKFRKSQRLLQS